MPDALTWSCMVCGDERPDEAISVAYRPIRGLAAMFPNSRVNVRYCNDRSACIAAANASCPWPKPDKQLDDFPPLVCMRCGTPQAVPPPMPGVEPARCSRCDLELGFVHIPSRPLFKLVPLQFVVGPGDGPDLHRQVMVQVQGRSDLRVVRHVDEDELVRTPGPLREHTDRMWVEMQRELREMLVDGTAPPEPAGAIPGPWDA